MSSVAEPATWWLKGDGVIEGPGFGEAVRHAGCPLRNAPARLSLPLPCSHRARRPLWLQVPATVLRAAHHANATPAILARAVPSWCSDTFYVEHISSLDAEAAALLHASLPWAVRTNPKRCARPVRRASDHWLCSISMFAIAIAVARCAARCLTRRRRRARYSFMAPAGAAAQRHGRPCCRDSTGGAPFVYDHGRPHCGWGDQCMHAGECSRAESHATGTI